MFEDFATTLIDSFNRDPIVTDTVRERIAAYTSGTIALKELSNSDGTQAAKVIRMCERFAGDLTQLIAMLESLYVTTDTQAKAVADALVSFSEMLGTLILEQQA